MRDKTPKRVYNVLRFLGDGLSLWAQLNKIHETGEWPKYCTEVTMTTSNRKPKATKCSNHYTISLIAHSAQIAVRIFSTEKKTEDMLGQDSFGFIRGMALGMQLEHSE